MLHSHLLSSALQSRSEFSDRLSVFVSSGKVLICCKQGVEHSATLFLAYVMICHDMMVEEAIDHVMKLRRIRPSRDVLKKLVLLNADLVQDRKLKLQDIQTGRNRKIRQLKRN